MSRLKTCVALFLLAALLPVSVSEASTSSFTFNDTNAFSITDIAAGANHTCALLNDGTVKCWGLGASGQLGQGNANSLGDGVSEMGTNLGVIALGSVTAVSVTAGANHTCALLNDGTVKCWGLGASGQV
jgi:alpha-tubulin suppressor-like RCC1 family protein